ncbi:DUF72 domain-containing protein [Thiobacter aerophilum]|uniref:DUF72 domain-containing protein n=1 Tax=Thiobacter aerophilum TaxID=3121275 RepID=A0ABV0EDC1_9BURK
MTQSAMHFCALGAMGWEHGHWLGAFYPEDLPTEWRLSYYATQFDCVFLTHALWAHTAPETLSSWAAETLERFRFLLEHPPGPFSPEDQARLAALGERGVALGPERHAWIIWFDANADLKLLAQRIQEKGQQAYAQGQRLYIISLDADLARIEAVRTLLEVLGY